MILPLALRYLLAAKTACLLAKLACAHTLPKDLDYFIIERIRNIFLIGGREVVNGCLCFFHIQKQAGRYCETTVAGKGGERIEKGVPCTIPGGFGGLIREC